jgi:aspartate/methionine/tyrosine aminotransferase
LNENNINILSGGTSNAISLTLERLFKDCKGTGEVIILSPFFGPYLGMVKLSWGNPVLVDTDS